MDQEYGESFKAMNCGADCMNCPLKDKGAYVSPEKNKHASIAIVVDHPSEFEVQFDKPLVGPASRLFNEALGQTSMDRGHFHITMAVLCQPPENNMKKYLAKIKAVNRKIKKKNTLIKRENEKLVKNGLEPLPLTPDVLTPHECCHGRLMKEIERFDNIMPLGSYAVKAIMHSTANIMDLRGSPSTIERYGREIRVLPSFHPAMVSKSLKWIRPFFNDIKKAVTWFTTGLDWEEPNFIWNPTAKELKAWLKPTKSFWAYDLETDGLDPLQANIRCIGIAKTPKDTLVVSLLSIDGVTRFYPKEEEEEIRKILTEFFLSDTHLKYGWNSGSYDKAVMESQWGITPAPHIDGILYHRLVESELPHSLGFVGSMYTNAPSWKTTREGKKKAYGSETDEELAIYCLMHGTQIVLEDGSTKPIQEIVRSRYSGNVLSVVDGKLKACKVINWYDTYEKDVKWYQVIFENQFKRERGLICTHDHKLIGPSGEIAAQHLKQGDKIWHYENLLSSDEIQALLGTLLGDTSFKFSPTTRKDIYSAPSVSLTGGHVEESGFAQWKEKEVSIIKLGSLSPAKKMSANGRKGLGKEFQNFHSPSNKQLKRFVPYFLTPEGDRKIETSILNKMGSRGLAWWYMDDGCKQKHKTSQDTCVISCQRYPREQMEKIRNWFCLNFGDTSLCKMGTLRLGKEASLNFAETIAPYLPQIARYKLPRIEGKDWSLIAYIPIKQKPSTPSVREVISSEPYFPPTAKKHERYKARHRYCIDVEESHNFFTTYGLVHNCAWDSAITHEVLPYLHQKVHEREQTICLKNDHKIQRACSEMQRLGMYVCQKTRKMYEQKYITLVNNKRNEIREHCDVANLNPGSPVQLQDLLYEKWNLLPALAERLDPKEYLTEAGEPATKDAVMRALLSVPTLEPHQRKTIDAIRQFRKAQKALGTYVTKMRYRTEEAWGGWDEEDSWLEKDLREKYGAKKLGLVDPRTNRMHPTYNAHGTSSGRLSSNKPNAQNFIKELRSMIIPAPGNIFVGADADQLELRIAAARWRSVKYLEAFEAGLDPHSSVTAYAVFGKKFEAAAIACGAGPYPWKTGTKFKGDAKRYRNLAKCIGYASQYAASVETVHRLVTQMEVVNKDGTTSLPYLTLSVREVRGMHRNWMRGAQYDWGWNMELESYRRNGAIFDPLHHRRRDFLNGENTQEIVNFPIQSSAAAIMNDAMIEIHEQIPFQKWGPNTGIINQCHDAIVIECPEDKAQWVMDLMTRCMNRTYDQLPGVVFTAEAETGMDWSKVG